MEAAIKEEKKEKSKWPRRILNFLMYGGWLAVALFIMGIILAISVLSR
jgi:hypothetical protein